MLLNRKVCSESQNLGQTGKFKKKSAFLTRGKKWNFSLQVKFRPVCTHFQPKKIPLRRERKATSPRENPLRPLRPARDRKISLAQNGFFFLFLEI